MVRQTSRLEPALDAWRPATALSGRRPTRKARPTLVNLTTQASFCPTGVHLLPPLLGFWSPSFPSLPHAQCAAVPLCRGDAADCPVFGGRTCPVSPDPGESQSKASIKHATSQPFSCWRVWGRRCGRRMLVFRLPELQCICVGAQPPQRCPWGNPLLAIALEANRTSLDISNALM